MARSPADKSSNENEKSSGKSSEKSNSDATTGADETAASAASGESVGAASGESKNKSRNEGKTEGKEKETAQGSTYIDRLKSQLQSLQQFLDKRNEASAQPLEIAKEFAAVWLPHFLVERDLLRQSTRSEGGKAEALAEVEVRKDLLNLLLSNLLDGGPKGAEKAALDAMAEQFAALAQAGQREDGFYQSIDSLFTSGQLPMSQVESRHERLKKRFERIDDDTIGEAVDLLAPRRLSVHEERQQSEREYSMPRYSSQTRDRDEQGRFLPDEERDYGRGGSRGGGYRSTPQRDEAGRFVSDDERRSRGRYEDDDDRYRSRRSSGRDYEDDDRRSGGRQGGRGGWFGDPEGHSEASHRGWERSEHEGSGWYGDREGHSQASRRGWERSEHEGSGWYGDREGHSEASRRGWEEGHRSQRRDDDDGRYGRSSGRYESRGSGGGRDRYDEDDDRRSSRGYESRGRYEDEDERGSGRGHGGWSGDPEGHSEAARRGWEHRRR
jgi:hypothetical protein